MSHMRRWALKGAGLACVGLGAIGIVLPVLPTTPFMIVALWCFSRSSDRLHDWLFDHRLFGPALHRWETYRIIPPLAKLTALSAMSLSLCYLALFSGAPWYLVLLVGLVMGYGAWFILSKPSGLPTPSLQDSQVA